MRSLSVRLPRRSATLALVAATFAASLTAQSGQTAPAPSQEPKQRSPALEPARGDRFGWNSRERTAAGIVALEKGDAARAKEALDTALRLRPADPTAKYNAGTGRLAAGDPTAAELLDGAAQEAPADLAPAAWYNLGEAKLAQKDFKGAADSFIETLKRDPGHSAAKHNLELALRELQKQQQQKQKSDSGEEQDEQQKSDQDSKGGSQGDEKNDRQQDDKQKTGQDPSAGKDSKESKAQQGNGDARDQSAAQGGSQLGDEDSRPKPLPQFHDLPDMTADQAAAILRAVENLERQQRQERAAKAAQAANAAVEIDW